MNSRCKFLSSTPVEKWPSGDRKAWEWALNDDPLAGEGTGGASGLRPATLRQIERSYGAWLTWLRERGHLDEAFNPGERASLALLRDYLAKMRWSGDSEHSTATRSLGLSSAFKVTSLGYGSKRISRAAGRIIASAKHPQRVSGSRRAEGYARACLQAPEVDRRRRGANRRTGVELPGWPNPGAVAPPAASHLELGRHRDRPAPRRGRFRLPADVRRVRDEVSPALRVWCTVQTHPGPAAVHRPCSSAAPSRCAVGAFI